MFFYVLKLVLSLKVVWRQTNDLSEFDSNKFFISREEVDRFFLSMDRYFDGRLSFADIMGEETPIEKLFKLKDKTFQADG